MGTIYEGSRGVIDYPDWWKWNLVIKSTEDDTTYTVTVTATLSGTTTFNLDLMEADIWWSLSFDGTTKEVLRVYRSNGRYQDLAAGTYGSYTLTKTYNKIDGEQYKNVSVNVHGSANVYTNMLGITPFNVSFTIPSGYTAPSNFKISPTSSSTNSITTTASWTSGLHPPKTPTATISINNNTGDITESGKSVEIKKLSSNTKYTVSGKLYDGKTTVYPETNNIEYWTYPIINNPVLTRRSGYEHSIIDVSVSANVASDYDQFAYKLGNGSWTNWTTDKTHSFTGLSENTTYTVYVKMKNTSSGYESAEKSASITTWYNPVSNLNVVLVNRWYWYMEIKSSYKYNGSISKFEFAVGNDEDWVNKGTTNLHSRGSTTPGWEKNLKYNTTYTCWVRLTDNHGRIYNKTADFKTLDERPLYVGNELREVKLIQPDGTVKYITPNLLSVVQPNGTVVNMNKIINNDSRTEYK